MRRFPWDIVLALLAGVGLGLVYAWMIAPLNVGDADPGTLRSDFKDQYRSTIAAAYAATNNLPRAQARLSLLQDSNAVEALNAQAQRMLARAESAEMADQVAALAQALEEGSSKSARASKQAAEVDTTGQPISTATQPPASPDVTSVVTETLPASTPIPTNTIASTQPAPFKLTGQDELCDRNLPDGLLQVVVLSSNRRQMPGIEIDIAWEGSAEKFFTGLKPELGNGYADYILLPNISYTVQLAAGSDIAAGLTAPTCQTPAGETFNGGLKLTFQQP